MRIIGGVCKFVVAGDSSDRDYTGLLAGQDNHVLYLDTACEILKLTRGVPYPSGVLIISIDLQMVPQGISIREFGNSLVQSETNAS